MDSETTHSEGVFGADCTCRRAYGGIMYAIACPARRRYVLTHPAVEIPLHTKAHNEAEAQRGWRDLYGFDAETCGAPAPSLTEMIASGDAHTTAVEYRQQFNPVRRKQRP